MLGRCGSVFEHSGIGTGFGHQVVVGASSLGTSSIERPWPGAVGLARALRCGSNLGRNGCFDLNASLSRGRSIVEMFRCIV